MWYCLVNDRVCRRQPVMLFGQESCMASSACDVVWSGVLYGVFGLWCCLINDLVWRVRPAMFYGQWSYRMFSSVILLGQGSCRTSLACGIVWSCTSQQLQQDLADRRMAYALDSVAGNSLPKEGNLLQCQNYRTISLICHASKVMLKILLNRLTPQAETIIAEEQAGFRPGRSTTEQIFSLRILCERYLQHQQDLFHVFCGF